MANTLVYEATFVDWNALRLLAIRAAQQTPLQPAPLLGYVNRQTGQYVQLLGPHWVLDHRRQNSEGTYGSRIEEDHTDSVYALLPDGGLVHVEVVEETWTFPSGGRPVYKDRHTVRNMTDSDVQDFDFTKDHYSLGGTGNWAAGERRGALIHDSKGVGLTRALNNVLAGLRAALPGPLNLHVPKAPPPPAPTTQASTASISRASSEWSKRKARRERMRRNDRIFDKLVGALKGGAVGLIVWWILALVIGLVAGLGVAIVLLAAVAGAMLE